MSADSYMDIAQRVAPFYRSEQWRWSSCGIPGPLDICKTLGMLHNNMLAKDLESTETGGLRIRKSDFGVQVYLLVGDLTPDSQEEPAA